MLRDNLVELIEPMLNSAGADPLALYIHTRTPASDDRLPCLKNPRPEGAESSLTESASSPFQAEPAQIRFLLTDSPPKFPLRIPQVGSDTLECLGAGMESKTGAQLECEGLITMGKTAVLAGYVEYRDIFGKHRISNFGYRVTPDNKFESLTELPDFGKHT